MKQNVIRLSADQSDDEPGAVTFTIAVPEGMPLFTRDREAALEHLETLGVENGDGYLDEAKRGGVVEIVAAGG
jgi:hypothetical protein